MEKTLTVKKYSDWQGDLGDFLQVGDLVDQEMVDYFLNVLPPITWNNNIIQISEPNDHVDGKATYSTLVNSSEGWRYAGNCHRGQTQNKVNIWEQIRQCRKTHANVPIVSNGQEAWICGHSWGVGVRFYPVDAGFVGMKEEIQDGFSVLMERL